MRQALPALALYAMLLQAFLGAAAPSAAGYDPATAAICNSLGESAPSGSGDAPSRHGCICLSTCAHAPHAGAPPVTVALAHRSSAPLAAPPLRSGIARKPATAVPALGARAPPLA